MRLSNTYFYTEAEHQKQLKINVRQFLTLARLALRSRVLA